MEPNNGRFDVQTDVLALRDALNNFNKDGLINILCVRNLVQRREIVAKFNETSDSTLDAQIKSLFDGDFQKIMLALVMNPIEFYTDELHTAFEKLQTGFLNIFNTFANSKYNTIASILCPLSNRTIEDIKSLYEIRYGRKLEKDINDHLSLQLKELLLAICESNRDEIGSTEVNIEEEVRQLSLETNPYDTDKITVFIKIFAERNFKQLKSIVEEYKNSKGQPIEIHLEKIFKKEDVLGYMRIVEYSKDKYFYFARCLFDALDSGTSALIGLVLLQCDDLLNVKHMFELNFGDSLRDFIRGKSSKHYKHALYKLFGEAK